MSIIDIDKFIVSLKKELWHYPQEEWLVKCIDNALKEQNVGIGCSNSSVGSIEQKDKTQESKPTEFESRVAGLINGIRNGFELSFHDEVSVLLEAAKSELESEERLGITKKEFEDELEHFYHYADEVQYNRGYDKGLSDARVKVIEDIKEILLSNVLPCFMHGGEADEVVAKLDEVMSGV
jgi:hypothetical protein